jgi:hypothetical protein
MKWNWRVKFPPYRYGLGGTPPALTGGPKAGGEDMLSESER